MKLAEQSAIPAAGTPGDMLKRPRRSLRSSRTAASPRCGPSSTSQVTQAVSVTRQAATKHLELLEAAGLVISSRRGRERIWTLQTRPLIDAGDYLNQLSRRWDAAIDRLRTFVED